MTSNKSRFNPKDYYFSTPNKGKHGIEVFIVPKQPYDINRIWDTDSDKYQRLLDHFSSTEEFSDFEDCYFVYLDVSATEKQVQNLLQNRGFIYNPKLGSESKEETESNKETHNDYSRNLLRVVMMVGLPASGKSIFADKFYDSYTKISKDICKTKKKEFELLEELLSQGKNVVIDDTNYNKETRAELIAIAHKYHAEVQADYLDIPKKVCLERNKKRPNKVPDVAIHTLASKLEVPTEDEGFIKVNIRKQLHLDRVLSF